MRFLLTLVSVAVRSVFGSKSAPVNVASEMCDGEAAYWRDYAAALAAEQRDEWWTALSPQEDAELRAQFYQDWLLEQEREEQRMQEWRDLEAAHAEIEDDFDGDENDDEADAADLAELKLLASENCPDNNWQFDWLGDGPLAPDLM